MKHFEHYIFWGLVAILAYYGWTRVRNAPASPVSG